MLQRLYLRNFQTHEKQVIELDPLCTTFVGESDLGKTSIIRSLRWILLNKPAGARFIRWGSKRAKGKLTLDNKTVTRIRSKSANLYLLGKKVYKAFGNDVPPTIAALANVTEANFQLQHQPHYLLALSPGQAAQALNEVVNLGEIDRVQKNVATQTRQAKATVKVCKERFCQSRKLKNALKWVLDADEALRRLESLEAEYLAIQARLEALQGLLDQLKELEARQKQAQSRLPQLKRLIALGDNSIKAEERLSSLQSSLQELANLEEQRQQCRRNLRRVQNVLRENLSESCPLCGNPSPLQSSPAISTSATSPR